jgi:hypothetical protein
MNRSATNLAHRPSVYSVTGAGRDAYIGRNNGGLYNKYQEAPCMSQGTFQMPNDCYGTSARPKGDAKHYNYSAKGCGRDSYIA